ncbi:Bgt-2133 [Blumeria graminis f. sp. tritici]|uniref:Bgt-2133 n=2 Tax=Blumeria graminis f. sp. tritici TaxID=62690 RepID=A0A381LIL0_BLUGR|nr:hypothetical protein BGT96224_2133 [Blumeria graminis f. sp. tritici 96224]VCU38805.1 Bgt-2133 [Blumeria graminis f. sp. tritici]
MEHQQCQSPQGSATGPSARRLHIAHRRSPSELTPLMSMFSSPGMEQLAIQQQIELLQQQQQQIQATHQQYVNMGMIPPTQHLAQGGGFTPLQQQQLPNMSSQSSFQFPNQMQQSQINGNMGAPAQPMSHRRNQSAVPNMGMGPPPAPSSGTSSIAFNDFNIQNRENITGKGSRGGGGPPAGGHQRRHSLALPEAKKAAELAQQQRTTSGFQFPLPGAASDTTAPDEASSQTQNTNSFLTPNSNTRGTRISHGRSQSVAAGPELRRGSAARGGGSFQFPTQDSNGAGQPNDFQRRGSYSNHTRSSSRNFDGNWRNNTNTTQPPQDQQNLNNFQNQQQQGNFQPGHRSRSSVNQSISATLNSFQFGGQAQLVPLPQGQMALVQQPIFPGQQLNPLQINQLQALQAAQMNGHVNNQQIPTQAQQQQQRKTLFTPYLPQATLPALLGDGRLVSGILRVNKKNRSDAYVTTQDGLLDADIFICGSKDRNRALEGDLVAVELLDVGEVWAQKREKEEKKKRKDFTDNRSGSIANGGNSYRDSNNSDDQFGSCDGGIRRRGSLRQRPTQKKNDDVEVEGQSLLLVEEEEVNDDQKPLYAGHIVAVIERVPGQMFSGTLGLLRPSSQATKEKQEAERQARDGGVGRFHEQRHQDKPKIVWFKPTDKRVPLIAIPTEQAPRDFVEKHQDYADRIFVACIKRWPITSLHPFGTLVEQLGKMGELKVETDALLRDNNFANDEFSDAVQRSVDLDGWSLEKEDQELVLERRDFREEEIFTVDLNGTDEHDCAIHVKTEASGNLEIGIHIADYSHFVKANSLVDREAKRRGTAVYLMTRSCAIYPSKIATNLCSFIPLQDRLAVSVVFKVQPQTCSVLEEETWVGKSIVKSSSKISRAEMDNILSSKSKDESGSCKLRDLHNVAQNWRETRLNTDEKVAPLRLIYQLDDENSLVERNIFNSSPSVEVIEELMHKANAFVAQKIFKGLPEKAFLRRQSAPKPGRLQTFAERMNLIGHVIDTTSSGSVQNSLFKIEDADVRKGMETLFVKTMHRAKYFVPGKTSTKIYEHYALNLPLYTHFACPSRRYADLVVHRQLEAVLSDGKIEYVEDLETLAKTAESCNTKKDSALNAQEQSIHIESCRIMDRKREEAGGELIAEGIVICIHDSAFDVLIPEYGFEKRVHCDQLPLKKAEFRKKDRVLELYWEKGVSSSTYVPEDERNKGSISHHSNYAAAAAAKQAAVAERAKKEHEEAQRKQMESGTIPTDDVDALFDDDDCISDMAESLAGTSLTDRPTQSVPSSPTNISTTTNANPCTESESRSNAAVQPEIKVRPREKYSKLFTLREENGEYIQDVKELMRVPVILKTDLTKSPPCLTIRSLNPYAL